MAEESGQGVPFDSTPAPAGETPEVAPAAPTSETPGQKRDVLYMGIDLGTANSSVATSSGIARTVPSVVGWPKDLVAYKFLQKSIVFGEECIRNRMTLDLVGHFRAECAHFATLSISSQIWSGSCTPPPA